MSPWARVPECTRYSFRMVRLVLLFGCQFSCSVVSDSLQPHESQHTSPPCPSPTPRDYSLMAIESVMPSSHLILCRPLLLLPPILPSIRVFSSESTLRMKWPEYWSFSFSIISPSNEYPGLLSFRMDWLGLLAVQGTLKSLLQHHSSSRGLIIYTVYILESNELSMKDEIKMKYDHVYVV